MKEIYVLEKPVQYDPSKDYMMLRFQGMGFKFLELNMNRLMEKMVTGKYTDREIQAITNTVLDSCRMFKGADPTAMASIMTSLMSATDYDAQVRNGQAVQNTIAVLEQIVEMPKDSILR